MIKILKFALLINFIMIHFISNARAADQVFFYHTDPVGTPMAISDANGQVVWRGDYKPFGEEASVSGALANDRKFVGKEKDEETGLYYFGARYMDAKTGRFAAVDPVRAVDFKNSESNEKNIINPQRLNFYAYSANNPFKFIDLDGRDIVYLLDKYAVNNQGHAAGIVGPIDGKWHYESYGKGGDRGGEKEFSSEVAAMQFAKDHHYTNYAKWYTDEDASKEAKKAANKWFKGFHSNYKNLKEYIFVGNNCQDMVNDMLKAAKVDFVPRGAPNMTFFHGGSQGADIVGEFK
jgi:RHS repeat-associated protein